jgi:hypothetical protein
VQIEDNLVAALPPWEARSCGVVSLFDMIEFRAAYMVTVANRVGYLEGLFAHSEADAAQLREVTPVGDDLAKSMKNSLKQMLGEFEKYRFTSSSDGAQRLLQKIESGCTQAQCHSLQNELARRIQDEVRRRKFYQLDPDLAKYFGAVDPFGPEVSANFRSASHDIREASNCYACQRYDATVYHLMRALESPLRCLAKTLHIKYTPGWAGYLKKIDNKLKYSKTRIPKRRKEFLSNASALLWAVKDAWRNDAMHLESIYGPDQTARIFESTKAFMMHLATELKETS